MNDDKLDVLPLDGGRIAEQSVYFLGGLGGHVVPYKRLARSLDSRFCSVGLLHPNLCGHPERLRSIEAMAAAYAERVETRAEARHIFFGFSVGGAVAFQLAADFKRQGFRAGAVVFDTFVASLNATKVPLIFPLRRAFKQGLEVAREWRASGNRSPYELARIDGTYALRWYRPQPSEIPLALIRPAVEVRSDVKFFDVSEDYQWTRVARVLPVERCDGDHFNAFKHPQLDSLAKALNISLHAICAELDAGLFRDPVSHEPARKNGR